MWEYDKIKIDYKSDNELITELNKLGNAGWEIINYFEESSDKWHEHKVIVLLKKLKSKKYFIRIL